MPRFGIVTLSYNKPKYIADTIRSVLNQTFTDFLYVVVDNSTIKKDQVMPIIRSFSDPRMIVIEESMDPARRQTVPINHVLSRKYSLFLKDKGCEYLKFLSDDDIIYENCLEELDKYFKENPNQKACYYWMHYCCLVDGERIPISDFNQQIVFNDKVNPDCIIDGGMLVYHSSILNDPILVSNLDKVHEGHADGVFMSRVAKLYPIPPLKMFLSENRAVDESCYNSRAFWRIFKNKREKEKSANELQG